MAQDTLDRADSGTADAQDLAVEDAVQLEEEADRLEAAAWEQAIEADAGDPWPPSARARELATSALAHLDDALASADDGAMGEDVRERLDRIAERVATLGA